MASLRNIMNVDEDHFDSHPIRKDQEPGRSSQVHHTQPTSSTYTNPANLTITGQNTRRSPSSHHRNSSYATESSPTTSPPGHPASNTSNTDRRQSNTSTDSMDSRYGQSHGHGHSHTNSFTGAPMRPFMPSGGGETSVKLTPITGRVSRAKKGVPVHTCDMCRPPKTFTRAEHLRRHQLSHQPPDLACPIPGCGRVFHRKDLLERHQQRHDQDASLAGRGGDNHRRSHSNGSPHGGYNSSPPPSMPLMSAGYGGRSTSTNGGSAHEVPMAQGPWSTMQRSVSSRGNPISQNLMRSSPDDFGIGIKTEEEYIHVALDPELQDARMIGYAEPRTTPGIMMANVTDICMTDARSNGVSWVDSSAMASSASGSSTYSTPSETSRCHQPTTSTSSAGWNSHLAYPVTRDMQSPIPDASGYPLTFGGYSASPPQGYASIYGEGMGLPLPGYGDDSLYGPQHGPNTTVRSLSPHLVVGQSSETLVTAPSVLPSGRVAGSHSCGRQPGEAFGLLTSQDTMPMALSRGIRSAIPSYLDVYWDKVHPMYPIIHKATFEDGSDMSMEHRDILECSMAAIATQFLQHKEHRVNGNQLHAYAMEKSKMYPQSEAWPLPIMQAALLCEYFGRFRGRDKEAYRPSQRFGTLFQMVVNSQIAFEVVSIGQNVLQQWSIWIDIEARRRLFAACFMLDVHSMRYHEQTRSPVLGLDYSSPSTLPIPLTASTTSLWDAQNCDAWNSMNYKEVTLMTVANTMPEIISPADVASSPQFDASLLLAAHSLQLPGRRNPTTVDLIEDATKVSTEDFPISRLFGSSAAANSYLALHYTPLHYILSVSGDSWVFNKKVLRVSAFIEHQKQLEKWRRSGSAAVATAFAARALKIFLNFLPQMIEDGNTSQLAQGGNPVWTDMSDFWAVYICTLICWAFGHVGKREPDMPRMSRSEAMRWINTAAEMQPGELEAWSERHNSQGVVSLVREVLEKDCLGGRNILFTDAVGVIKRLDEVDNCKWF